jgi:hypothetical protein
MSIAIKIHARHPIIIRAVLMMSPFFLLPKIPGHPGTLDNSSIVVSLRGGVITRSYFLIFIVTTDWVTYKLNRGITLLPFVHRMYQITFRETSAGEMSGLMKKPDQSKMHKESLLCVHIFGGQPVDKELKNIKVVK